MNNNRLRIAIVGMGMWGTRAHLPALARRADVDVSLCHTHPERIHSIASRYGIAHVYEDSRALLREVEGLTAVVIATPDDTHRDLTLTALDAGVHVFCEKPLAYDVGQAREMVASLRASRLVGKVGFLFRYSPVVERMKELLDEGYIGDLRVFESNMINAQFIDPQKPLHWKMQSSRANGGVFVEYGSHIIDLALWFGGPIASVVANGVTFVPERPLPGGGSGKVDVDDESSWIAIYERGGEALFRTGWASLPVGCCGVRLYGSRGSLAWELDCNQWRNEKLLASTMDEPKPRVLLSSATHLDRCIDKGDFPLGLLLSYNARLLNSFVSDIRTGRASEPSFEDGLAVQLVLEAIRISLRERRWVELESDK